MLDNELQFIYLVCDAFSNCFIDMFLLTWNFNPKVLYSPSAYKDEQNFIALVNQEITNDIVQIGHRINFI